MRLNYVGFTKSFFQLFLMVFVVGWFDQAICEMKPI